MHHLKDLAWVGSSRIDLKSFPLRVQKEIGFALHQVQEGKKPLNSKPLKGIDFGVLEIVSDHNTNTFRTVYAVKLSDTIYVLHAFQKKSTTGIKTPKKEMELIKSRLIKAKEHAKRRAMRGLCNEN